MSIFMGLKGTFIHRDQWGMWVLEKFLELFKNTIFLLNRPQWLHTCFKLVEEVEHHGPFKTMNQLKCDIIYEDLAVSSARFHGIKGLGTELTARSEELAKERGCTHTHAVVTGTQEISRQIENIKLYS